eukprot:m.361745 g.361745  ORF g.361745 m.361745 type:complete len:456 (-) comp28056_c1_seq2:97-1464(-)
MRDRGRKRRGRGGRGRRRGRRGRSRGRRGRGTRRGWTFGSVVLFQLGRLGQRVCPRTPRQLHPIDQRWWSEERQKLFLARLVQQQPRRVDRTVGRLDGGHRDATIARPPRHVQERLAAAQADVPDAAPSGLDRHIAEARGAQRWDTGRHGSLGLPRHFDQRELGPGRKRPGTGTGTVRSGRAWCLHTGSSSRGHHGDRRLLHPSNLSLGLCERRRSGSHGLPQLCLRALCRGDLHPERLPLEAAGTLHLLGFPDELGGLGLQLVHHVGEPVVLLLGERRGGGGLELLHVGLRCVEPAGELLVLRCERPHRLLLRLQRTRRRVVLQLHLQPFDLLLGKLIELRCGPSRSLGLFELGRSRLERCLGLHEAGREVRRHPQSLHELLRVLGSGGALCTCHFCSHCSTGSTSIAVGRGIEHGCCQVGRICRRGRHPVRWHPVVTHSLDLVHHLAQRRIEI